jgi:phosphohistidine phosphatase
MKTLLVLRHAKSDWGDPKLADEDRPLNKRGKRDAVRMGELLRARDLLPELILTSTAKRARKTAEAIAEASAGAAELEAKRSLYLAGPKDYVKLLRRVPEECQRVMVVGHNPGLEELLGELTGTVTPLPTAALAEVALPIAEWRELGEETRGELRGVWRPRELA